MKKKQARDKPRPARTVVRPVRIPPRASANQSAHGRGDAIEPKLPADPARFWRAAQELERFETFPEHDRTPALKILGPLPFARGGFPVMGFLATLYEHVARYAADALSAPGERQG